MTDLPIDDVLPALKKALRDGPSAVLQAPTGAGKTTRVPLALLGERWLDGQRILVLEPRRLAARSAARRMAQLRGERVAQTVGYRVRMDTQIGKNTRVEVITEGVLTRMLQSDAALEGVGAVIFDEFHERSLQADLGLALTLESRAVLRPELRVLAMSATLDAAPVADLLGDAPLVTSEGRSYPVEERYANRQPSGWIVPPTVGAVQRVLRDETGDVLVFLPGAGEIRHTERRLREGRLPENVRLEPLFGNLSNEEQDRAIEPSAEGERKVVLSTDIAESSLTIEGIRVVVDGGLTREPRFSPQSGMTRLETVKVSKASADQRKGRAGRLAPGVCERLWTRHTQQHLRAHAKPEIVKADLAPLALDLAAWGTGPTDLRWLDPPPEAAFSQAQELLRRLGALNEDDRLTAHGEAMADLGLHPRLAHLVLRGRALGEGALACDLAALLDERDVFQGKGEAPDADLRLRLEALCDLRAGRSPKGGRGYRVKEGACRHVLKIARHWQRQLDVSAETDDGPTGDIEAAGTLAAFAYPDRLTQRRRGQDGRFRVRNGQAAELPRTQMLAGSDYLAVAHVGGRGQTQQIRLAAPLREADLRAHFGDQIQEQQRIRWDDEDRRVRARRQERIGALVLLDGPLRDPNATRVAEALLRGVRNNLHLLPWSKNVRRLRERLAFMHHHHEEDSKDSPWPDVSDEALLDRAEDWLLPHLYGLKSADDLSDLNLVEILKSLLSWEQRSALGEHAPTHIEVPSGSRRPIDYSNPETPVLAVRLQEMFGLTETPRIGAGRVPLTLHLLSPAQRPVQVTQDLAHFWAETYFEVRKDMRGRYPKHYWPKDPYAATPTNRVRPEHS